jgi:hypothetical protein
MDKKELEAAVPINMQAGYSFQIFSIFEENYLVVKSTEVCVFSI